MARTTKPKVGDHVGEAERLSSQITGAQVDLARVVMEADGVVTRPDAAAVEMAESLVAAGDELAFEVLRPGRWPQARTVARFMEGDRLERVLALYHKAMIVDPYEPAYPWNLSSLLSRLGMNELALAYIERALRIAVIVEDESLLDSGAFLAWAEAALRAGQDDVALIALVRAKERDPDGEALGKAMTALLRRIRRRQRVAEPERSLAEKLLQLAS